MARRLNNMIFRHESRKVGIPARSIYVYHNNIPVVMIYVKNYSYDTPDPSSKTNTKRKNVSICITL